MEQPKGAEMKIYLLILLVSTLLTAIRFTPKPEMKAEPQRH
jgi:hypothetical protein